MRLKHLELQGYKTFATRTEFAFDGGITAIVGPNGSGKSNVADALRWVLGEQSFVSLRGKRTEDMIFSGSVQRARLGMASASLVLDNEEGWLPIDFSEVTIARRAYRSGENEYLLNGRRVRLRDITQLLSKSGLSQRSYTVIGQGLVDAVLSLRADDRRALFEEAAGISLHRTKRTEALSRLDEAYSNLLRVNDIINEISPRLGRLGRQAERAELYLLLTQQLEGLLRTWYGYRWRQMQLGLARAQDALARRDTHLERRREALEVHEESLSAIRSRQTEARDGLGAWHRESGDLHRQMEQVQRDLAVWQERGRLLARRNEELEAEAAELSLQLQATEEKISSAEAEVAASLVELRDRETADGRAQADLDELEATRARLSGELADIQAQSVDLSTAAAERRSLISRSEERRKVLGQEREDHAAAVQAHEAQIADLRERIQPDTDELSRLAAQDDELKSLADQLEQELAELTLQQERMNASLAEDEHAAERLGARYELLSRMREEGEGLRAGVQTVLRASRSEESSLSGVIGTIAQLLHVRPEYEPALEVALGTRLQDIVVERWADAEAAISHLNDVGGGRATFIPLDMVRKPARVEMPPGRGIHGVGSDLVEVPVRLEPVVEMLLGQTIVAEDLETARRAFERLKGSFQIATVRGELVNSRGSVTGGQGGEPGRGLVLAREREWRELPGQLKAAQERAQNTRAVLVTTLESTERLRERQAALETQRQECARSIDEARTRRADLERKVEQTAQQVDWLGGLVSRLDKEEAELVGRSAELQAELERLEEEGACAEERLAGIRAKLEELEGEKLYQRLSDARTAAAVARGTWQHRRAALEALAEQRGELQAQAAAKQERIDALRAERETLAEQIDSQTSQEAVIKGWLASLAHKIEPAERETERLEQEREKLEQAGVELRARLREAETGQAQALLASRRQEDRLERIRGQITEDFGLVDMEPTEGLPEQLTLPLAEMVSALPAVEVLPEGLEEEVHRLKAQIRRMGSVNPSAPADYAEVLERHEFLTAQAADLDEAIGRLRQVIAELDEVMRLEFQATFKSVDAVFQDTFKELFGGGAAHLELTDPENLSTSGVEIVARPPGKRPQTLAQLSGGERSLTAVALIFALLETNPPPFCLLDEVDAMLDEANIRRFRRVLEELARRTQFIVITHNRGTIEAANTIYGVSMGDDSISQVVSMRLEGNRIVAPEPEKAVSSNP